MSESDLKATFDRFEQAALLGGPPAGGSHRDPGSYAAAAQGRAPKRSAAAQHPKRSAAAHHPGPKKRSAAAQPPGAAAAIAASGPSSYRMLALMASDSSPAYDPQRLDFNQAQEHPRPRSRTNSSVSGGAVPANGALPLQPNQRVPSSVPVTQREVGVQRAGAASTGEGPAQHPGLEANEHPAAGQQGGGGSAQGGRGVSGGVQGAFGFGGNAQLFRTNPYLPRKYFLEPTINAENISWNQPLREVQGAGVRNTSRGTAKGGVVREEGGSGHPQQPSDGQAPSLAGGRSRPARSRTGTGEHSQTGVSGLAGAAGAKTSGGAGAASGTGGSLRESSRSSSTLGGVANKNNASKGGAAASQSSRSHTDSTREVIPARSRSGSNRSGASRAPSTSSAGGRLRPARSRAGSGTGENSRSPFNRNVDKRLGFVPHQHPERTAAGQAPLAAVLSSWPPQQEQHHGPGIGGHQHHGIPALSPITDVSSLASSPAVAGGGGGRWDAGGEQV